MPDDKCSSSHTETGDMCFEMKVIFQKKLKVVS